MTKQFLYLKYKSHDLAIQRFWILISTKNSIKYFEIAFDLMIHLLMKLLNVDLTGSEYLKLEPK